IASEKPRPFRGLSALATDHALKTSSSSRLRSLVVVSTVRRSLRLWRFWFRPPDYEHTPAPIRRVDVRHVSSAGPAIISPVLASQRVLKCHRPNVSFLVGQSGSWTSGPVLRADVAWSERELTQRLPASQFFYYPFASVRQGGRMVQSSYSRLAIESRRRPCWLLQK